MRPIIKKFWNLLPLLALSFCSGCACLVDYGETWMRERDYREAGFSPREAESNARYDRMWEGR